MVIDWLMSYFSYGLVFHPKMNKLINELNIFYMRFNIEYFCVSVISCLFWLIYMFCFDLLEILLNISFFYNKVLLAVVVSEY